MSNLHRKSSSASLSCNQSLLNEAALDTPQWQQRKGSVCILFLEDVTHPYTHAHDTTIRKKCLYPFELYLIQSDMQTDMCMHIHKKNVWATCNAGLPNYYQLLCINKPWHKSSDESATPNTLETLPRLAHCRRTGQIGRAGRGRKGGREMRKAHDKRKRWIRREGGLRGRVWGSLSKQKCNAASGARRFLATFHCLIWAYDQIRQWLDRDPLISPVIFLSTFYKAKTCLFFFSPYHLKLNCYNWKKVCWGSKREADGAISLGQLRWRW